MRETVTETHTERSRDSESNPGRERNRDPIEKHRDKAKVEGRGPARWPGQGGSRLTNSLILTWKLEEIGLWLK